jgi:hypothetical protein
MRRHQIFLSVDFSHSIEVKLEEFTGRSFHFRAACRVSRLLASIQ